MSQRAQGDVWFLDMLHKVGPCIFGEELVRPWASYHGQLAWLELPNVLWEGGGLLGAVLICTVCCTCSCLNGAKLSLKCCCVVCKCAGGGIRKAA